MRSENQGRHSNPCLGEEATFINICISNGSLKCHRVLISAMPSFGDKVICWYTGFTFKLGCRQAVLGQNLTFKALVWPWKWGQGHQNLITSLPRPNNLSVPVWSKFTHGFRWESADKKLRQLRRAPALPTLTPKAIGPPPTHTHTPLWLGGHNSLDIRLNVLV